MKFKNKLLGAKILELLKFLNNTHISIVYTYIICTVLHYLCVIYAFHMHIVFSKHTSNIPS